VIKLNIPENLTGKEALTVHDFLVDIAEAIWKDYEDSMIEAIHSEDDGLTDEKD